MQGVKIDPGSINIADDAWELLEMTEDFRRYRAKVSEHPDGTPVYVIRTEHLMGEELLRQNAQERNDTDGTRWSSGMGSDQFGNMPMVKVSSMPLNIFYRDVAPRLQQGDKDEYLRWYLNRDENKPFRTRNGNI